MLYLAALQYKGHSSVVLYLQLHHEHQKSVVRPNREQHLSRSESPVAVCQIIIAIPLSCDLQPKVNDLVA